jgi:hypothetical protein
MDDNEAEAKESSDDESDPENESHGIFQKVLYGQFARYLELWFDRRFECALLRAARREVICQATLVGYDLIEIFDRFRQWCGIVPRTRSRKALERNPRT